MFGLFLFWISQFKDVFTKKTLFYKNFQGFKHCSIFHFQGSVFVSFVACFSSATRSLYQSVVSLSSTFLFYFFDHFSDRCSVLRCVHYITRPFTKCQPLFYIFLHFLFQVFFFPPLSPLCLTHTAPHIRAKLQFLCSFSPNPLLFLGISYCFYKKTGFSQ